MNTIILINTVLQLMAVVPTMSEPITTPTPDEATVVRMANEASAIEEGSTQQNDNP